MTRPIWGIHNDTLTHELVDEGFISLGWDELGDLRRLRKSRDSFKDMLFELQPEKSLNSIAGQAGVLFRFAHELKNGDVIVAPYKPDSTINIGVVSGDYYYEEQANTHRHRRRVRWIKTDLPRAVFSQSALYELGCFLTFFKVTRHTDEIMTVLNAPTEDADELADTVSTLENAKATVRVTKNRPNKK